MSWTLNRWGNIYKCIRKVRKKIDRDKVFFNINCHDEETAQQLLKDVEKIGK